MDFTLPIWIGITNSHWVRIFIAHLDWLHENNIIGKATYDDAKEKLNLLSDDKPEPSFDDFKLKTLKALPVDKVKEFIEMPAKYAFYTANAMVIRDNNDFIFQKYSEYRDNLRDIASGNLSLFQILDDKVTTLGYEFALFYNDFKTILENLMLFRNYAEFINNDITLDSYLDSYEPNKLDFIAKRLGLSKVTTYPSENLNFFISSMISFAPLVKSVIKYVKLMSDKKMLEVDTNLFIKANSSADALLSYKIPVFQVHLSLYSRLFVDMDSAVSNMYKIVTTMKLNLESFEKETESVDKKKYLSAVSELAKRIFNEQKDL